MIKRRIFPYLLLLLIALLFCLSQASASQVVLNESNNDAVAVLVEGQSLELSLATNPSTGFVWRYVREPDKELLTAMRHKFRQESQALGAGSREYWSYKATGAGITQLSLWYIRPWESRMPAKTFKLDIIITPPIKVLVDSRAVDFDVPPFFDGGRVLVPIRAVSEALGAEVNWRSETEQVEIKKGDSTLMLTVGGKEVTLEDAEDARIILSDVSPRIAGGRVFVPLRLISEALGCEVDWDGMTLTAYITTKHQYQYE